MEKKVVSKQVVSTVHRKVSPMGEPIEFKKGFFRHSFEGGSAFILVFVLTTLLAAIGLVFLLSARIYKMSTSALAQNRELNSAVDTIVSKISQQLVWDTPGVDPNINPNWVYYDYPDPNNPWLANIEPYYDPVNKDYRWRQISDIYNKSLLGLLTTRFIAAQIIPDYQDPATLAEGLLADADGDGIADSKWIVVPDTNTSRGDHIFAAVRVIDNSSMINVNTAYEFAPFSDYNLPASEIDGSSQLQINLMALAGRNTMTTTEYGTDKNLLNTMRTNGQDMDHYEGNVTWNYGNATGGYTPFDISDELEIRNRFLLNHRDIDTRLEDWGGEFRNYWTSKTPFKDKDEWFRSSYSSGVPNIDPNYSYRHIATINNVDRIIDPYGIKKVNIRNLPVNADDSWAQALYENKLLPCIDQTSPLKTTLQKEFAQVAANIKDYADKDNDSNGAQVTTVQDLFNNLHYGFERPEICISEITISYIYKGIRESNTVEPNDPNLHRSYAIEIYNDFRDNEKFYDWRLVINTPKDLNYPGTGFNDNIPIDINLFQSRGGQYYVAVYEDPCSPLLDLVKWSDSPRDGATGVDPNVILRWGPIWGRDPNGNWIPANAYDVYFGTDPKLVANANSRWPIGPVYQGRKYADVGDPNSNNFNPFDSAPMAKGVTYYWRIAGVNDIDHIRNNKDDVIIDSGQPPWRFTTWIEEPNSLRRTITNTDFVLNPASSISLERRVKGKVGNDGFIIVDFLGPDGAGDQKVIPPSLFNLNDANGSILTHSFQRDLGPTGRLKRLWSDDAVNLTPTLGHSNLYSKDLPQALKFQTNHYPLNNVGELGFIFKKSTYYEVPTPADRIQENDTEYDVKLNVADPNVQRMFNFLTVMDPAQHGKDVNETRVKGRINVNTAPWYVLAQLPWVSIHDNIFNGSSMEPNYALAKAFVAYRDKQSFPLLSGDGIDYTGTRRPGPLGFENIGQLNNVILNSNRNSPFTSIRFFGLDGQDQRGFPDLSTDRRTKVDGYPDDMEERDLIFARISDLVTVRSDVFTAYILVRLGPTGPQKRVMAILDRSEVTSPEGKVRIRALYPVPDSR